MDIKGRWRYINGKGYSVSNTGYFVYCNGNTDKAAFDGKLEFDITLIDYVGNDEWVESKLNEIKMCLESDQIPQSGDNCDFCVWFAARNGVENM